MRRSAVVVVAMLTAVLLVGAGASAASAGVPARAQKLPKDACALLTDAQVATVAPSAAAQPQTSTATQASCLWGSGASGTGTPSLSLGIDKLTISAAKAKAELKASAKKSGVKPTKGVGDFAYQASPSPPYSHLAVLDGKLLLTFDFSAGAPVTAQQKAALLALAKTLAKQT